MIYCTVLQWILSTYFFLTNRLCKANLCKILVSKIVSRFRFNYGQLQFSSRIYYLRSVFHQHEVNIIGLVPKTQLNVARLGVPRPMLKIQLASCLEDTADTPWDFAVSWYSHTFLSLESSSLPSSTATTIFLLFPSSRISI